MAKDLKGRELGVGISQRPDGLYTARYTSKNGKRVQKYFKKLQDCRKWIADVQFSEEHENVITADNPTVDAWFNYWMDNVKKQSVKNTTYETYSILYSKHVKNLIGEKLIKSVRPIDCQTVLNKMEEKSQSTTDIVRIIMSQMFDNAVENMLLAKNPVTKSVKVSNRSKKTKDTMTLEEQSVFLNNVESSNYANQFKLIFQTGMRIGEVCGLKWEDIDFTNKTLSINRTIVKVKCGLVANSPKSKAGKRTIPLTNEAVNILKNQKNKSRKTKINNIKWNGYVFLNSIGNPYTIDRCNNEMRTICEKSGIRIFTTHALRHLSLIHI